MKQTQYLSNFQKEQYTHYLECQLEKFSTFMLSQKKQNQKYKHLQDIIYDQNSMITHLKQKMELVEVYAHHNHQNHQIILKNNKQNEQLEHRMRRLEDRLRFGCDNERLQKHNECSKELMTKDNSSHLLKLQKSIQEINKKVKYIEQDITVIRNHENRYEQKSQRNNEEQLQNLVDKKTLKKLEKRLKKDFALRFQEIENIIRKSHRKKSKSPAFVTPIDGAYSQSSINNTQKILSQFKINDQTNLKSDYSTVSRQTKLSKRQESSLLDLQKKKKKRNNKSQSRSKSKSQTKDESISKSKSRKKSKGNRSISCSQDSYMKSSINKSKINKSSANNASLSKSKSKSKSKKKGKDERSRHYHDKQNREQPKKSCTHEKCKIPSFFIQESKKLQKKIKIKQRR